MKATAQKEDGMMQDYENWRPYGWLKGTLTYEDGATDMLQVIIARMEVQGMAPELFFSDDEVDVDAYMEQYEKAVKMFGGGE